MKSVSVSILAAWTVAMASVLPGATARAHEPLRVSAPASASAVVSTAMITTAAPAGRVLTARDRLSWEVMAELNAVRTNPDRYVQILRAYRQQFNGMIVERPGRIRIQTFEGVAAVDEAIRFLQRQKALPMLQHDDLLDAVARDLVDDQGPSGGSGHYGSDGRTFVDRAARRGGQPYGGEVISYGYDTAIEVVIQLIVDDNVRDRGHRTSIFSERFARMGADCGDHARWNHMCVVDYGY